MSTSTRAAVMVFALAVAGCGGPDGEQPAPGPGPAPEGTGAPMRPTATVPPPTSNPAPGPGGAPAPAPTPGTPGAGDPPGTPPTTMPPAETPPPPAGTVKKLFDGTTLDGWDGNPKIWSVKDGAIDGLSPTGGQLIYTKGDYDSFRLTLESRLVSKTQHLGVCFWGDRSPTWGYANCILVIPPSGGMWDYHKGIKSPPHMNPAKANATAAEWHKSEILANAKTGEVIMAVNGTQVLIYKNMTGLKKGPIGLQIHNGSSEVQYREIFIEENPTEQRLLTVKP